MQAPPSLEGVVLDPSDAVVVGASITLRGPGRQQFTAFTDSSGNFRFDALAPGKYDVEVKQAGFKVFRLRADVGSKPPAPLRVKLEIEELQQNIDVDTADRRPNTEVGGNLDVIEFDPKMLQGLPILGNDIVGALSRLLGPGGAGGGSPTILVDGVPVDRLDVAPSAIASVRINSNPYSAEFARPGFGRWEFTTRSGAATFHGSLSFVLRDTHLDARAPLAATRPNERRRTYDGYLSGPVTKRTTFLLSFWREEGDLESVVLAFTPLGQIHQNIPNTQRNNLVSSQISHKTNKNTATLRYNVTTWTNRQADVGGITLPEAATNEDSVSHGASFTDRLVVSPKIVNELSIRADWTDSSTRSLQPGLPRLVVVDAFVGGGAQTDQHTTSVSLRFNDYVSWSHGRQLIKTGISIPEFSRQGLNDRSNFGGTYQFSSLADYQAGGPFSYEVQTGQSYLAYYRSQVAGFLQDDIRLRNNVSLGLGVRYEWQRYLPDYRRVGPRLALAWSPDKNRKTVIRTGSGVFYDSLNGATIGDWFRLNGQFLRQILIIDPNYPNPFSGGVIAPTAPLSLLHFDPTLRAPYTIQYGVSIDRQLTKTVTLSLNYLGTRGIDVFRSRDVNAPLPPLYLNRPDPSIGRLRQVESSGDQRGNTFAASIRGEFTRFLNASASYTFARTYGDTNGVGSYPANQYNLAGEWGRVGALHSFYFYGTIRAGKYFDLGIISSIRDGSPYSLTTGRDDFNTGFTNARPPGVSRNTLTGPTNVTLDVKWSREFALSKSKKEKGPMLQLAVDAFNVLNRSNFTSLVGNLSSPLFGQPVASLAARQMQITLGLRF